MHYWQITKLTKLAVDRAEYLLPSAELGLFTLAEPGLFADKFSDEPELSDPRSNFLFLADIFFSSFAYSTSETILYTKDFNKYLLLRTALLLWSTNALEELRATHWVTQQFSCCCLTTKFGALRRHYGLVSIAWLPSILLLAWPHGIIRPVRMTSMKGQETNKDALYNISRVDLFF